LGAGPLKKQGNCFEHTLHNCTHKLNLATNVSREIGKVNKFFYLPQYSMEIVIVLGDDVTVEVSYMEDKVLTL